MSHRLTDIRLHHPLGLKAVRYTLNAVRQYSFRSQQSCIGFAQYIIDTALESRSLTYFPIIGQLLYDLDYLFLQHHQFGCHSGKSSNIGFMGKLIDVVGFSCQFTKYVRIRLANALNYFTR